jgi:hypothetical protein
MNGWIIVGIAAVTLAILALTAWLKLRGRS